MNIIILGTGNVATVLGRLLKKSGFTIMQVYGRNVVAAEQLAAELGTGFCHSFDDILRTADLYILALSDRALSELPANFNVKDKVVVHTAGSVSMDVLNGISENYGVVYPLQSLRKEIPTQNEVPLLVNGNNEKSKTMAYNLASTISSTVMEATDEARLKFHVAAVFVNNFTNHLYALAEDFCVKEEIGFHILRPLIFETANRIAQFSPTKVITGPASRNDMATIEKHLEVLEAHPQLHLIYQQLTDSIKRTVNVYS